jgi:hypothetical protein
MAESPEEQDKASNVPLAKSDEAAADGDDDGRQMVVRWKIPKQKHRNCPLGCYKPAFSVVLYVAFGLLFIVCAVMLCLVGLNLIAPYRRSLQYLPTTCEVVGSNFTGSQDCNCGRRCTSTYSCLMIYGTLNVSDAVTAKDGNTPSETVTTVIYDTEYNLDRQKCTFRPKCFHTHNDEEAMEHQQDWGLKGQRYTCFRHPRDPKLVFRERQGSIRLMLHLMLWPSIICIICIVGTIVAMHRFGCQLCHLTFVAFLTCRKVREITENGYISYELKDLL